MFRIHVALAGLAIIALGACTPPQEAREQPFQRIDNPDDFGAQVVGNKLTLGDELFVINVDRTFEGRVGGKVLGGTWTWQDGFWCRVVTVGDWIPNDCQVIEVRGAELRVTRERGAGESTVYGIVP